MSYRREDPESIYNLVPVDYYVKEKQVMHKSCHNPKATLTGSTFGCKGSTRLPGAGVMTKKPAATWGPRYEDKVEGTGYLKKRETEEYVKPEGKFQYANETIPKKSPVPDRNVVPVMGIKTNKNFITANAVEAILTAPRVVPTVDPIYIGKEDFGKIPNYLVQVKEEIKRENAMIDRYVKERLGYEEASPDQMEELSDQDRNMLLAQLKAKWDAVNAEYQRMTHLINLDSCGLVRRKVGLENSLKTLEADIAKLSRAGPVVVRG
jgi:hypothetical protein